MNLSQISLKLPEVHVSKKYWKTKGGRRVCLTVRGRVRNTGRQTATLTVVIKLITLIHAALEKLWNCMVRGYKVTVEIIAQHRILFDVFLYNSAWFPRREIRRRIYLPAKMADVIPPTIREFRIKGKEDKTDCLRCCWHLNWNPYSCRSWVYRFQNMSSPDGNHDEAKFTLPSKFFTK